jgi:hypothetical protein
VGLGGPGLAVSGLVGAAGGDGGLVGVAGGDGWLDSMGSSGARSGVDELGGERVVDAGDDEVGGTGHVGFGHDPRWIGSGGCGSCVAVGCEGAGVF